MILTEDINLKWLLNPLESPLASMVERLHPPYYQQVFHRGKTLFHLQAILKTVRLFPLNYFCGMQKEAFANAFVCDLLAKLDQVYEHALNATKLYVNHCYVQLVLTTHALLLLIFANLVG